MAQKSTILIVEDVESNRILLEKILSDEGYTLILTSNGEEALQSTLENDFDLILLDIMMPKKDGFTVFEELKRNKKTAKIPVIFISVLNNDEDTLKAYKMGAVDFISKPFTPTELRIKVRTQVSLAQSHKIFSENFVYFNDLESNTRKNTITILDKNLDLIKNQISELKKGKLNAEEKKLLEKLKSQINDILNLISELTN